MRPDQVNTAEWKGGWTNLLNDARQNFVPSLPRLMAVSVELVVGNPGPDEDLLTLSVLDGKGKPVGRLTQRVSTETSGHVLFQFPGRGLKVSPGTPYSLQLRGGTLFGWKYVVGGYENGDGTFNGKPLVRKADGTPERSTFLFRTFGAP